MSSSPRSWIMRCGTRFIASCTGVGAIIGSTALRGRFFSTSENLVKTQIWMAVLLYMLIAIIRERLGILTMLHSMLKILSGDPRHKNPAL